MATQPEPLRGGDFSPIGNAQLWDGIAHWGTIIATGQFQAPRRSPRASGRPS